MITYLINTSDPAKCDSLVNRDWQKKNRRVSTRSKSLAVGNLLVQALKCAMAAKQEDTYGNH